MVSLNFSAGLVLCCLPELSRSLNGIIASKYSQGRPVGSRGGLQGLRHLIYNLLVRCSEALLEVVLLLQVLQALLCTKTRVASCHTQTFLGADALPQHLSIDAWGPLLASISQQLHHAQLLSHGQDNEASDSEIYTAMQEAVWADWGGPAARQNSMASCAACALLASSARQDSSVLFSSSFIAPDAAEVCRHVHTCECAC